MLVKPEINHMLDRADSRFALVIATAKRARQLTDGATQLVDETYAKPVTTAAHEIGEDKIVLVSGEEMRRREAEMKAEQEVNNIDNDEVVDEMIDSVIEQVASASSAEEVDVEAIAEEMENTDE